MSQIITLTGPSGIGKTYVKRVLKKEFYLEEPLVYTTRSLRPDEEGLYERISISEEDFDNLEKEFVFVNDIFGYKYGLKKDIFTSSEDLILELYVDNVPIFRILSPNAYMVAMLPSNIEFLKKRLRKRGEKDLSKRIESATEEIEKIKKYYDIFNSHYVIDEENEGDIIQIIMGDIDKLGLRRR